MWECGRVGVWAAVATQWLNKTAQGFSPGLGSQKKIALTGRPSWTLRLHRRIGLNKKHGFSSAALLRQSLDCILRIAPRRARLEVLSGRIRDGNHTQG